MVVVMLVFVLLIPVTFSFSVYAADDTDEEWKTHYAIGKFLNSEPAKPDQIFKIQYRVIDGEIEEFGLDQEVSDVFVHNQLAAKATSEGEGILEIKFPRNFPYGNWLRDLPSGGGFQINDMTADKIQSPVLSECSFNFSIPFNESVEIIGFMPSITIKSPYRGDNVPDSCVPQTITNRPLHQVMADVAIEDVRCPEGLQLIIHPNGKPYCATTISAEILKERWGLER